MKVHWRFLKFDSIFQTILFVINTICIIWGLWSDGLFIWVLLLQPFLGFYQIAISGLVNLMKAPLDYKIKRLRKIHFWGGIGYSLSLVLFAQLPNDLVFVIFLFIIPQVIAYAYYFLTIRDYMARMKYLNTRPTIFAY